MSSEIAGTFAVLANDPSLWLAPGLPDGESLLRLALLAAVALAGVLLAIVRGRRPLWAASR